MNVFGNNSQRDPLTKSSIIAQFNNRPQAEPDVVTQRYINLACAIIEEAVDDWRWLDKWDADTGIFLGSWIKRHEIMNFFYGGWFETLLSFALPDIEADEVRYALKVGKYDIERNKNTSGDWYSKYYSKH